MARGTASRRWLLAWVIFLGFMFLSAWTVREARLATLSRAIIADLKAYAETGTETPHYDSSGNLLYTENNYLWDHQGPMVFLIEHGHRDPALLRTMLLCEARRSYNQTYLYPRCYNWDLRQHLIRECTAAYPDDPLVHWATGRCYLAAGYYEEASVALITALSQGFDYDAAGTTYEHFAGRIITSLLMWNLVDDAVSFAAAPLNAKDAPAECHWIHADLLCKLERYAEAKTAAETGLHCWPGDIGLLDVLFRSYWWLGDADGVLDVYQSIEEHNAVRLENSTRVEYLDPFLGYVDFESLHRSQLFYQILAEQSCIHHDPSLTEVIDEHSRQLDVELQNSNWNSYPKYWSGEAKLELVRSYVLCHRWDELNLVFKDADNPVYFSKQGSYHRPVTLSSISPRGVYQTAVLLNAIAQTGSPPVDTDVRWNFGSLIEGGTLPYLLHSSHFASAAEYAGRDVDQVRAEVIAFLAPERETYHDGTNGELDW